MVNYTELEDKLTRAEPYKHGSSHAMLVSENGKLTYYVYSYSTLMLQAERKGVEDWNIVKWNDAKYSSTTSRLQNLIRKHWDVA